MPGKSPVVLRDTQIELAQWIDQSFLNGNRYVLAVSPTGSGKTVVASHVIAKEKNTVTMAHRQELVEQISGTLNRDGVWHSIIGPASLVRNCTKRHYEEHGKSFYAPMSNHYVMGIDTALARIEKPELQRLFKTTSLWVLDEAHHLLRTNKWGKVLSCFERARGLGFTATPTRADGKGLGVHADGLFNDMVVGASMKTNIELGYLTPYVIYAPKSDIDVTNITIGRDGDYSKPGLRTAAKKSHIVGDVVMSYMKFAYGKRGVTFATDVETAGDIAGQFNASGVPAKMVHAGSTNEERYNAIRLFRCGKLLQLVNVDLFGEGFDLPACECVSMARPTASYGLFVQQFGRALRPMPGKPHAIIIDHVNNVIRHRPPDRDVVWSLDARDRSATRTKVAEDKACPMCTRIIDRFLSTCPYCGHTPVPKARSSPEFVDGDLTEMPPELLKRLRGEVEHKNKTADEYRKWLHKTKCPKYAIDKQVENHKKTLEMRENLLGVVELWFNKNGGTPGPYNYRKFYCTFGVDILSLRALNLEESYTLIANILEILS